MTLITILLEFSIKNDYRILERQLLEVLLSPSLLQIFSYYAFTYRIYKKDFRSLLATVRINVLKFPCFHKIGIEKR